jgi:predicted amidophosphoribosyltransferase
MDHEAEGRGLWSKVLDLVYPSVCHGCGDGVAGNRSLCGACHDELPSLREPFCRSCGEEFEGRIWTFPSRLPGRRCRTIRWCSR